MSLEENVALLEHSRRELWNSMIVRLPCEIISSKTVNVLHVGFILALVISGTFVIQIHQDSVLVAELIHDVMVGVFSTVHKDGLERVTFLRSLFENLHYVFWFDLLRASWLDDVLYCGKALHGVGENVRSQSLNVLSLIRF